jgi:hypothetical protein
VETLPLYLRSLSTKGPMKFAAASTASSVAPMSQQFSIAVPPWGMRLGEQVLRLGKARVQVTSRMVSDGSAETWRIRGDEIHSSFCPSNASRRHTFYFPSTTTPTIITTRRPSQLGYYHSSRHLVRILSLAHCINNAEHVNNGGAVAQRSLLTPLLLSLARKHPRMSLFPQLPMSVFHPECGPSAPHVLARSTHTRAS